MSAKTTGLIWDIVLSVPQRMVLLAMVDHADHDGEHIHAPAPFIAWKTGYSERNVYRIIQDLIAAGILVITGSSLGEANEYRFDFSRAAYKPSYRGKKPKRRPATPDKMTGGTPDKMSGGKRPTPDKMSAPPDKMAGGTPDMLAIDHVYTFKRDHDSPPPPTNDMSSGGGGAWVNWLIDQRMGAESAQRFSTFDPIVGKADFIYSVGSAEGTERDKRIGRLVKRWTARGCPTPPPERTNGHLQPPPSPLAGLPSHAEAKQKFRETAAQLGLRGATERETDD